MVFIVKTMSFEHPVLYYSVNTSNNIKRTEGLVIFVNLGGRLDLVTGMNKELLEMKMDRLIHATHTYKGRSISSSY